MQDQDEQKKLQRLMNPQTLKKLQDNGSDLSRPHTIINIFYVFGVSVAPGVTEHLENNGFKIKDSPKHLFESGSDYWVIEASKEMLPDIEELNKMTDQCVEFALSFEMDYDGWYTEVVPIIQ